jgi:amylosucrase
MISQSLSATQRTILEKLAASVKSALPERKTFLARLERFLPDLMAALEPVYPQHSETASDLLERLLPILSQHHAFRPQSLRDLDLERTLAPDWFERPDQIAYVAYTERFAGNLAGVLEKLPYLQDLGVTYLHLMPFLQPRPAPHDGGYAVADYRKVRSDLGTMQDLENLTQELHAHGMSLCCDLVLNHVALEHEWAAKARARDLKYQNYFLMYPDRIVPDQYERTLPEVFPDFAPGNFTWDDASKRWVWTTFNAWQWDLNWANPDVFLEFVDLILWLANKGIDIFRLDAIAFIWKRMGTNCQNLPEVHALTQALRACVRIVAPAVIFKAEAIVSPNDLIAYLGQGEHFGKVSDTAYHNSLMVQIWSSLAARDTRLMTHALRAFPEKPANTAWNTYLRCHDDIGWAIDDDDARAVGVTGEGHRRFLSDFYAGFFQNSFARGVVFQENKRTGDRRISGSGASLAGLEIALERNDKSLEHLALERLLMAHALVLGYGGIPLIYMGDELAMLNDPSYLQNPEMASDNRWIHRPEMDWARAENAKCDPNGVEGRMYHGLKKLIEARVRTPHLHASFKTNVLESRHSSVFVIERPHPTGSMVGLFNFSEQTLAYPGQQLLERGITQPIDQISRLEVGVFGGVVWLEPYARLWLLNH